MKKVLNLIVFLFLGLAALAQSELTVEQNLEDYDFVVQYIEDNYAGFPDKVTSSTCADYGAMKTSLRDQVTKGEASCWDALARYTAWFNDRHLRLQGSFINEDGHWIGYTDQFWLRQNIYYDDMMDEYNPTAVACKVTDKTFLIRFPSCEGNPDKKWVNNSIKLFKNSHCENLILDIRGNGGGHDGMWIPYLLLLYDHEYEMPGVEYRNSPQNIEYIKNEGGRKDILKMAVQTPEAQFLKSKADVINSKKVDSTVRKAALMIDDGVESSGEEMVLNIKACSNRVTVFGRDNTGGCLDYSNLAMVKFNHLDAYFGVPMSRRIGLPETSIDVNGIAPDVRIDLPLPAKLTDNIDEWVIWVAEQLEK